MAILIAVFALGFVALSDETLTREELITVRDSLRVIAVEFHSISAVVDNSITRNGGPAPMKRNSNQHPSEAVEHSSVESLLRQLRTQATQGLDAAMSGLFPKKPEDSRWMPKVLFGLINIEVVATVVYWIGALMFALLSFCFDSVAILLFQGILKLYTVDNATPRLHPGRSRSPVREDQRIDETSSLINQLVVVVRVDRKMQMSSILSAIAVQLIQLIGLGPLNVLIFALRIIAFLLVAMLMWDHLNSSSLKPIPYFGTRVSLHD